MIYIGICLLPDAAAIGTVAIDNAMISVFIHLFSFSNDLTSPLISAYAIWNR